LKCRCAYDEKRGVGSGPVCFLYRTLETSIKYKNFIGIGRTICEQN
jgi:hypothetical protein